MTLHAVPDAPVDPTPHLDELTIRRYLRGAVYSPEAPRHPTYAPFDGRLIAQLPLSSEGDVESAFNMARRAQERWSEVAVGDRAKVLLRYHDLVLQRQADGLDIAQLETGKARRDAFEELLDIALNARYYARVGPGMLRDRRHTGVFLALTAAHEVRHPKGVVGIIAPWNYPLTLAVSDALPALLAGNAVVLKPDLQTTVTALWTLDLLREAGLPDGVMNIVIGDGPVVGPHVVDRADYVMFTGSTRVGREIAARCGERLIGVSLELGGKNATIVRADADVSRSAEIAVRGCFANSGQLCISSERLIVHEAVADKFVEEFVRRVVAMRLRAGVGWGADMGSLISAKQLDTVTNHVADAIAQGARVLTGGRARPDIGPYFFEPTVLEGVTEGMLACREETFGPVVSIYRVDSDEEALAVANDSAYGLNASILSRDTRAAARMARSVKAGTIDINEAYGAAWGSTGLPMGGMRNSGLGRRHGTEGLLKYTEPQGIAVQKLIGFGPAFGRTDEQWAQLMTGAIRVLKAIGVR